MRTRRTELSQIQNDSEKLREYAHSLRAHGNYWNTSVTALSTYMGKLGHTWRDDQFTEFEREVRQLTTSLNEFSDKIDQVAVSLNGDADVLEKIRNVRS